MEVSVLGSEECGLTDRIHHSAGKLRNGLQRGQKSQHVTLTVIITLETHPKQIPKSVGETSRARPG